MTNLVGAAVVLGLTYLVLPLPAIDESARVRLINAAMAVVYILFAVWFGARVGRRLLRGVTEWLSSDGPADTKAQRQVLRAPGVLFRLQLGLWWAAALLFGAVNIWFSGILGLMVTVTIAITGVTTGACAYLLAERILRKPATRALSTNVPDKLVVPGVATRAVLAWAFGSGAPVLGLVALAITALAGGPGSSRDLEIAVISLGAIALVVGLLAVTLAARATADPIDAVTRALDVVEKGDLDVRVPVYDGTQIGRLQVGFNRMAEGLAERERIRSALGTYVDSEVAARIVEEGTRLNAEEVEVTVMFLDIRNFTAYAEAREPNDVVALVNTLFELVIPLIHRHGGYVDKFIGDGLLAVFGAPRPLVGHADAALAAALEITSVVRRRLDVEIGIGLNSGRVIAGNVGGGGRLEYSVIGDPVNVAARMEAATRQTGDTVLVSEHTRRLLTGSVRLTARDDVSLKGKSERVGAYAPDEA
jgi:adenylate cyclase